MADESQSMNGDPSKIGSDRDMLIGTRPEVGNRVLMTSSDGFDGYEIIEYKGMVWGISIRAKDIGQDCGMGLKQIVGGELASYKNLGDESRQRALDYMLQMAREGNANGIINIKFELNGAAQGASQVVVYGTSVVLKPIKGYVPSGAIGNILYDIEKNLRK